MQHVPDPYRTLGVPRGASGIQIKAAHRSLAKRYHPDSSTGDTIRFLHVQEAYQLLSDPLRRREWDARHAPGPVRAGQATPPRPRSPNGRWARTDDTVNGPTQGSAPGRTASGSAPRQRQGGRDTPGPSGRGAPGPSGRGAPSTPGRGASGPPGRDPASRSYTWSASEVPWWEEHGPRENRRQPGRRRPPGEGKPPPGPARSDGRGQRAGAARNPQPDAPGQPGVPHEFDVYNRSSGAAWSSAARAFFRRAESDVPRRGSFQRQGSQPLTAARARVAAEEEARRNNARRQWPGQGGPAGAGEAPVPGTAPAGQAPPVGASAPARPRRGAGQSRPPVGAAPPSGGQPRRPASPDGPATGSRRHPAEPARPTGQPPQSAAQPSSRPASANVNQSPRSGRASGPAQRAYAWAGVTRDAQGIAQARSTAREASRAARWPSLTERMLYALICWLPIALLIGYAGSIVTGCDRASVTCPPYLETVQSLLIAFSLGLLVALPRLAYTGALATVGMLAAAMAVVIGTWLVGLRPPLPLPVLVVVAVVLVIVYLATANWALNDGPRRRPWMNEMRSWRELRR